MTLTKIEIIKYKSIIAPTTINFNEGLPTIFIGKNGSGKTNVLEALEAIAKANSQAYYNGRVKDLEYKVYFKLSKEEINRLLPSIEYDEKKSEVVAYSTDDGIRINRIESEYLVPELKKVVLDIREIAIKLKAALDLYKKQLYKLSHNQHDDSTLNSYIIEDCRGTTTNYFRLDNQVGYFIKNAEQVVDEIMSVFDSNENALNYIRNNHIYFQELKIQFKLKYIKPVLPAFEEKFITINETAIKREITKINKATAKACDDIQKCIEKITEQVEIILNDLDFQYIKQDEIKNKYFRFLREAQKVVAKKCLFLKNENNEILFRKQEHDAWNYRTSEFSLIEVYFRQVYQGKDREEIIEKLSKGEKINFSNNAVEEFEAYINSNLPKFEAGMFDKISIEHNENGQLSFLLHEKTGESIDLNETSSGRRWYFSYYFMKSILEEGDMFIIDEPASMLHPSAQREVLLELEELAKKGVKVVYSTHSPYLVPKEWNNVNFVTMTEKGTEISDIPSNQELITKMQEIVGPDIFDISNVISKYHNSDTYEITVNARKMVIATQKERKIRNQDIVCEEIGIAKDTLKSWNENSNDFHYISLENLLKVLKWANKRFEDVLN